MKIYKNAVQEKGLVGALYQLDTSQKLPAIIVLSGSDGGTPGANAIPESFIEHLTGKGFIVFALAYFGVETLCDNLQNIQLEYFEAAFDWLALQPNINREKISLLGQSRGAELALILGSIFPDKFHSIIACSPSSKICGAFPYPNRPAWLYQKKPLQPYLAGLSSDNWDLHEAEDLKNCCDENIIPHHSNTLEDPFSIKDLFVARNLQEKSEDAAIKVEKIRCPILLLSGKSDDIWPAATFCHAIMDRLDRFKSKIIRQYINYTNAGHGIISAYTGSIFHPKGQFWCRLGGTEEGNKIANQSSWQVITKFLQDSSNLS